MSGYSWICEKARAVASSIDNRTYIDLPDTARFLCVAGETIEKLESANAALTAESERLILRCEDWEMRLQSESEHTAFLTQRVEELEGALREICDRETVRMLCPTAPSADAAEGFKRGAIQATRECVAIARAALSKEK